MTGGTLKRKGTFGDGKEFLEFTPLGAGQEVGRSCHVLTYKGVTIMLDCGVHPGYSGMDSLPFFDLIKPKDVDLLLVTHFHLDHAAAVPFFLEKAGDFRGRTFMTHPTKAIYKLILQDFIKVTNIAADNMLYDERDLVASMEKIEGINFHQTISHKGVKFWCYNAGHVLGAAMFMIEIANVRILYTGDYSRQEDRHLMAAEIPDMKPDILIVEATYGVQSLGSVIEREKRFTSIVNQIVSRGGRCLIPVFALGRAQELLLILDEYWSANPHLHGIPVFYASSLGKKCMKVFRTFTNMMNKRIQKAHHEGKNPFEFKHVKNLKGRDFFSDDGPCVVLASPGMLQSGFSRELFESWCADRKNGLIIAGYCVQKTLAFEVLKEPKMVPSLSGHELPLNMSVHHISFSAHADFTDTSHFINALNPKDVILVHGERNEMGRLKYALDTANKEKKASSRVRVSMPKNCCPLAIEMSGRKIAKVIGKLAESQPEDGDIVSGLMIQKDFNFTMISASDLSQRTSMHLVTVKQSLSLNFPESDELLRFFLAQMFEIESKDSGNLVSVKSNTAAKDNTVRTNRNSKSDQTTIEPSNSTEYEEKRNQNQESTQGDGDKGSHIRIIVHGAVQVERDSNRKEIVNLIWDSNSVNDMIADSVVSLLMSCVSAPGAALQFQEKCCVLDPLKNVGVKDRANIVGPLMSGNDEISVEGGGKRHGFQNIGTDKVIRAGEATSEVVQFKNLKDFLGAHYGSKNIQCSDNNTILKINIDGTNVEVDTKSFSVSSNNDSISLSVRRIVERAALMLSPVASPSQPLIASAQNI